MTKSGRGAPRWLPLLVALGVGAASCQRGASTVAAAAGVPSTFGDALPGALPVDATTARAIDQAWRMRPRDERPRTRHLRPDGTPRYTNRLLLASSPYLRQHAHNPVDWRPWGDEAFATARRLGRPILLSVGYATCHWCHVMEEESFEDEALARLVNERYVAIKVDREERPDVDGVYLAALTRLGVSGGWPMTVWLTPDGAPFLGGTYFPREVFAARLELAAREYARDPSSVAERAAAIARVVEQAVAPPSVPRAPTAGQLAAALQAYELAFDEANGGLRGRMKFPSSLPVPLLLALATQSGDGRPLAMATLTLEKMAAGGLHDQLGGGFHRYATDAEWRVPHFEKTLYDNALLAMDYVAAWQATGRADFAAVARSTLDALLVELASPEGLFSSGSDADSLDDQGGRREGYYFTWTPPELTALLGPERARLVAARWGVGPAGGALVDGRSVLRVVDETPAARAAAEAARPLLLAARAKRARPLVDTKVLTSWNGLALSALARAGFALDEPRYLAAARRAADALLAHATVVPAHAAPPGSSDGGPRLLHVASARGTDARGAFLDDYALLTAGLLDLFEATGERRWLDEALALDATVAAHYTLPDGRCALTADDAPRLLARAIPDEDGPVPCGNSVEAMNLLRLGALTDDRRFDARADRLLAAFGVELTDEPRALPAMLEAVAWRSGTERTVVVVTPRDRAEARPLLDVVRRTFDPSRVLVVVAEGEAKALAARLPIVSDKIAVGGRATAYVCEHRDASSRCQAPTSDPATLAKQLLPTVAATPPR